MTARPKKSKTSPADGRKRGKAAGAAEGRRLVIVESPTKARTIGRFLGRSYTVMASMGHVRDLLKSRLGVDPEKEFEPTYRVLPAKREIVKALQGEAKRATAVYLAPDPDREGEAIAWHLVQALQIPAEKAHRVTFHEITERAVAEAFRHAGAIDMNKVNAYQARRILDRIVGYRLSPLLWQRVARGLSAGRVQSVAVRLIVEREKEIAAFKSETYWRVTAVCRSPRGGEPFEMVLVETGGQKVRTGAEPSERTLDKYEAHAIAEALLRGSLAVSRLATQEKNIHPPPPFTTSLLQQAATNSLGFSAKRTMAAAQQLYQGVALGGEGPVGLITYMRTDSVRFAPEALTECRRVIRERFGPEYVPHAPRAFKARKAAQEAHEAIRPTGFSRAPESVQKHLPPDLFRLYRLIWERAMASQMSAARYFVTQVQATSGGHLLSASGRTVLFDGYTKLAARPEEGPILPALAQGDALTVDKAVPSRHETQPPARYSEATLVKTLEHLGIGRPSTYAPTLSTIQDRSYVLKEDKRLKPTPMGTLVTELLLAYFPEVMDVAFTSRMEEELDEIAESKMDWRQVLADFYGPFAKSMAAAEASMQDVKNDVEETTEKCPQCGRLLLVKWSRFGKFYGCTGFSEKDPAQQCKYRRPFAPEEARPTGLACDKCGKDMVRERGRFGLYLRCQDYPAACTFTMKLNKQGHPVRKFDPVPTDQECAACGKLLVVRVTARGKRGPRPFLSCSGFPKCREAADLPEGLASLGAQALVRWQVNAVKNKADLVKYAAAMEDGDPGQAGAREAGPEPENEGEDPA